MASCIPTTLFENALAFLYRLATFEANRTKA